MTFEEFFEQATGSCPYPYQTRLATAPEFAELLRVPTGAGKTAAAVLGWLWRRHFGEDSVRAGTPRRLVYCLPMRVLVEQSFREAKKWVDALKKRHGDLDVTVGRLMGGVEVDEWYLHPERSAILIGTQDMLLSRALNRGYAASRFHWPIDFGLLNNDCLWVFDEPQLMGSGVSTSAQLAGLRAVLGTFGPCPSAWMSATLEPSWLDTVDFAGRRPGELLELKSDDYDPKRPLFKRMTANKTLHALGLPAPVDGKQVAKWVLERHQAGTQTLVVLNTVDRAKAVYEEIRKSKGALKDIMLVHSRFRAVEREKLNDRLMRPETDRIVVATQVVEAGVDLSARTLITELAPWASIVQRIGRCNRTGDDGPGQVFWVDLDVDKHSSPYEAEPLRFARERLGELEGRVVSPKALDDFKRDSAISLPFEHAHVLRRRDLIDLFDTTPDLSGNDIDVSRFVRGDKGESDVQVFWRQLDGKTPPSDGPAPHRRELCNVPVGYLKEFLKKGKEARNPTGYRWDHLDREWRRIRDPERDVYPGLVVLLPAASGGYSEFLGWAPDSVDSVLEHPPEAPPLESFGDDAGSLGAELTITEHTENVCRELAKILQVLTTIPEHSKMGLSRAARWHDVGKAHDTYQDGIGNANPNLARDTLWAKSGTNTPLRYDRRYFRHELVSALAALQAGLPFEVVYLIAAHHAKVRLSIRALPDEEPPETDVLFALGVHHGDQLREVNLGGETCPALAVDLSPMELGGDRSWTALALGLRDSLGPFRLAYLEAILRAADRRASKAERKGADA